MTSRLEDLADRTDPTGLSPRVLVGVSGGADSLALMATTAWVAGRMGLQAEAVIIDHGLQEGSDSVAARAEAACERLGADRVHVRRVQVDATAPGGVENAARQARMDVFDQLAEATGALAVLLAHTLDDQAEQVLMGVARGGGPRALAGIPRSRGLLLRPFLGSGRDERTALRRVDTEEICRLSDVDWWEDPMNADTTFLRARVRHELMPVLRESLGDHVDENLARSADLIAEDADYLDALAAETLAEVGREPSGDSGFDPRPSLLSLDVHALAAQPRPVRTRVLKDAARRAEAAAGTASGKSLSRRHVLEMDALVVTWHGQGPVPLPGRIEVARHDGLLTWREVPPSSVRP